MEQQQRAVAIPLCLPNNVKWDPVTGEITHTSETRETLVVIDEAVEQLKQIKGLVCVVSIAGSLREGKSFVLAESFDQKGVFPLGDTMDRETLGIWLWIVKEKFKDSNGQDITVVLLDSEGLNATVAEIQDDHQIFSLLTLLSSVLIYNSKGVPMKQDLDGLTFIAKLSDRIQLRTNQVSKESVSRRDDENLHKSFPFFIWLLRDAGLALPKDCPDLKEYFLTRVFKDDVPSASQKSRAVSTNILSYFSGFDAHSLPSPSVNPEVLANINERRNEVSPLFWKGLEKLKATMKNKLLPKKSFNNNDIVTGEGLAALICQYVNAINTPGMIPNMEDSWSVFVTTKCTEAKEKALKDYENDMKLQMTAEMLPCDNAIIREVHEAALEKALSLFGSEMFGISAKTVEPYIKELMQSMDARVSFWLTRNASETRNYCQDLIKQLKQQHIEPVLAQLRGQNGAKLTFADIVGGYSKIEQGYKEAAIGAQDVCATVFYEFHPELSAEMNKHTELLKKLKDYDEELTNEKLAKASEEQQRKRLEEEQHRLQLTNREQQNQLKLLSEKYDEETSRLRREMQDQFKDQQQQMKNMEKAAMEAARKQREDFARENASLNKQLLEMKESERANIARITELSRNVDDLEKAREINQKEVQSKQQALKKLEAKSKEQDANQRRLMEQMRRMEEGKEQAIRDLKDELAKVNASKTEAQRNQKALKDLEVKLKEQDANQHRLMEQMRGRVDGKEQAIRDLKDQLAIVNASKSQHQREMNGLRAEIASFQVKENEWIRTVEDLRGQIRSISSKSACDQGALKGVIKVLQDQLSIVEDNLKWVNRPLWRKLFGLAPAT